MTKQTKQKAVNTVTPTVHKSLQKRFECPICFKNFGYKDSLKVHSKSIHEKSLNFKCNFEGCDKKYFNQFKLTSHINSHTKTKLYSCHQCRKSFSTKGNLTSHSKLHYELKEMFNCALCNKGYSSKGNLSNHVNLVHRNIKRYQCLRCPMKFGRQSSLIHHSKIHLKSDYKCKSNLTFLKKNDRLLDQIDDKCLDELLKTSDLSQNNLINQESVITENRSFSSMLNEKEITPAFTTSDCTRHGLDHQEDQNNLIDPETYSLYCESTNSEKELAHKWILMHSSAPFETEKIEDLTFEEEF